MGTTWQVAAGGAIGAALRAAALLAVGTGTWAGGPLVTVIVVNLLGAAGLGWLTARARVDSRWRRWVPLLGTGLAGSLTTFSGLTLQLVLVAETFGGAVAAVAAVGQLAVGLVAAVAGARLGRAGGG